MTDEHGTEHDDVMSRLLDLQRRLRGDGASSRDAAGPDPRPSAPPVATLPEDHSGTVAVSERDLSVLMTPTGPSGVEGDRFAPVTQLPTATVADDRVAALTERLARLEQDLAGVMGSIEVAKDEVSSRVTTEVTAKVEMLQAQSDARLQRAVSERMYAVESRLVGELREQREEITGLVGERFEGIDAVLREAIHEAASDEGSSDAANSRDTGDGVPD